MNRRSVTTVVLVVASLLLVACGEGSDRQIASNSKADQETPAGPTAPPPPTDAPDTTTTTVAVDVGATVALEDDLFDPAEVQVTKGQAVAWKWQGKNPHNVAGSGFKSKIQTSGSFTRTFGEAGSFDFRCEVHPDMTGTVVVTG